MAKNSSEVWTVEEAAHYLGVKREWAVKWLRAKDIPLQTVVSADAVKQAKAASPGRGRWGRRATT
jgi:hypothetical protein